MMITIPKVGKAGTVPENVLAAAKNIYINHKDKFVLRSREPYLDICYLQESEGTNWLINDTDATIIKEFVNSIFSSAFETRIHAWLGESDLHDYHHPYPRVFIPVTNDGCVYRIQTKNNQNYSMQFKFGNYYVWDVRERHFVTNSKPLINRLVILFQFDPNKETIYKGTQ